MMPIKWMLIRIAVWFGLVPGLAFLTYAAIFTLIMGLLSPVWPDTTITKDLGGSIPARIAHIDVLRASGEAVRIVGQCASACTMLIGLPNACVDPSARLGFHGPQSQFYGVSLPPDQFEYWSRIMAQHYPPPLAAWFMAKARHTTMGLVTISGRDAIKMGAKPCK